MFISIPKEFFVPVIFSDGFILNQENDLLAIYIRYDKDTSKMKPYKVFRR